MCTCPFLDNFHLTRKMLHGSDLFKSFPYISNCRCCFGKWNEKFLKLLAGSSQGNSCLVRALPFGLFRSTNTIRL